MIVSLLRPSSLGPKLKLVKACRTRCIANAAKKSNVRLVCIGDVHSCWDDIDSFIVDQLQADCALFVGDFGDEDVAAVESAARVKTPKAVMLGNHEVWYQNPAGRKRSRMDGVAPQGFQGTRLSRMLQALDRSYIGYQNARFPGLGIQIVGGRPFSRGGGYDRPWKDDGGLWEDYFGVPARNYEQSAKEIASKAILGGRGLSTVLLAHNGPTGLGARRHDPSGKDWGGAEAPCVDFGDPDLEQAVQRIQGTQHSGTWVSLVVFGHMHHRLFGDRGWRDMVRVAPGSPSDPRAPSRPAVYLNTAVVPRWKSPRTLGADAAVRWGAEGAEGVEAGEGPVPHEAPLDLDELWMDRDPSLPSESEASVPSVSGRPSSSILEGTRRVRNFTLVTMSDGVVRRIREAWIEAPQRAAGQGVGEGWTAADLKVSFVADWLVGFGAAGGQQEEDRARIGGYYVWEAFEGKWARHAGARAGAEAAAASGEAVAIAAASTGAAVATPEVLAAGSAGS